MNISKSISFSIILVSVSSVMEWTYLPITNTYLWWGVYSWTLYIFYLHAKVVGFNNILVNFFLLLVAISFFYGAFFMTENYWDWKQLISNLMVFLLPMAAYTFNDVFVLSKTLHHWFRFAPILLIIILPFVIYGDAIAKFLVPYTFVSLWISSFAKKFRVFIIISYLLHLTLAFGARTDIIKATYCILIGLSASFCLFRSLLYNNLIKIWILHLFLPILFVILGLTGTFNIFSAIDEYGSDSSYVDEKGNEVSTLGDTRSFIYVEEINSAIEHNYILFGRSMARGYESEWFGRGVDADLNLNRNERGSSEVSLLNVFNYFGLVGVFVYMLIFIIGSYKAIFKSNNSFMPLLGLFVAFRWDVAFIEDFTNFSLNYLFLWIMIGMCFSQKFRGMSENEFKLFLNKCMP